MRNGLNYDVAPSLAGVGLDSIVKAYDSAVNMMSTVTGSETAAEVGVAALAAGVVVLGTRAAYKLSKTVLERDNKKNIPSEREAKSPSVWFDW